ncbi:hypothetical protein ACOSP7_017986 [Xanthoceras sorbifolium]
MRNQILYGVKVFIDEDCWQKAEQYLTDFSSANVGSPVSGLKQECRSSPPSGRLSFSVKTALSKLPLPLLALLLSLLIRGDLAELGCFRAAGAFFDQLSVVCGAQRAVVLEALDRVVWSCCGARSWRCSNRFCLQLGGAVIWWGCDLVELRGLLWRGPNQGLGSRSGQFGVWGS